MDAHATGSDLCCSLAGAPHENLALAVAIDDREEATHMPMLQKRAVMDFDALLRSNAWSVGSILG